ncbi:MAG: hypothetical protein NVS2B7_37200 [Herpetosiphon sp.]
MATTSHTKRRSLPNYCHIDRNEADMAGSLCSLVHRNYEALEEVKNVPF